MSRASIRITKMVRSELTTAFIDEYARPGAVSKMSFPKPMSDRV
jgi:hypothetical protein